MTRYAAFLRGINLGRTNKVAMPQLRAMAHRLGYENVKTYINSGNLVFTAEEAASAAALAGPIRDGIQHDFGLTIDVAVRSEGQLRALLASNPFPQGDPSRVTVAFLVSDPPSDAEKRLAAAADAPYMLAGTEVWVDYTQGQAGSRLAAQFSKVIGVSSTIRNLRTVSRTLALLDA
jgi:uncharacterized protein (DUF1697 family)